MGARVCQSSPRAALMQKRVHTERHTLVFQSAAPIYCFTAPSTTGCIAGVGWGGARWCQAAGEAGGRRWTYTYIAASCCVIWLCLWFQHDGNSLRNKGALPESGGGVFRCGQHGHPRGRDRRARQVLRRRGRSD